MGRRLNDKLPRVTIPSERITEAHWQQPLRERDARGKLRQKEYADRKRSAQYSDIGEGDHILLNKTRDNKLSPNFEPVSYKVVEKKGNVILKKDQEGNTKLCNSSHMKKSAHPLKPLKPTEKTREMTYPLEDTQKRLNLIKQPTPPPESSASPVPSRLIRVRRPPSWMNDFVSFWA